MANETNKQVTIDAAWFAELYRKANEADEICKECRAEHTSEEFTALCRERDELKEMLELRENELNRAYSELDEVKGRLAEITKDCVQYAHIRESLRAADGVIETELADKLKVIKELNEVRELNRKCCDENEELKAKLATAQNYEAVIAAKDREIETIEDERNRLNAKVNDMINELNETRELNRKCCDENEELKEKLDEARDVSNDFEGRLAAAEMCVSDIDSYVRDGDYTQEQTLRAIKDVIRAWREKREKEAAR